MDPSAVPSSPPPIRRRRSPHVLVVWASIACIFVVIVGLSVVGLFNTKPFTVLREIEILGQGHADLDVPLMTLYTAPAIPGETVDSNVSWSIQSTHDGPSTTYRFQWSELSPGRVPVHFALNSTSSDGTADRGSFAAVNDSFVFYPAGICGSNCSSVGHTQGSGGAGIEDVFYEQWRLTYTVFKMTDVLGSVRTSFLEVDFSILRAGAFGLPMPAANISKPSPDALAEVLVETVPQGSQISASARGISNVPNLYRNNVTTVTFDAGALGPIRARLTSEYSWSEVDDYRVTFSASKTVSIRLAVDLRFGSLVIAYVPDSGPP